jgi:hypothetical protein
MKAANVLLVVSRARAYHSKRLGGETLDEVKPRNLSSTEVVAGDFDAQERAMIREATLVGTGGAGDDH